MQRRTILLTVPVALALATPAFSQGLLALFGIESAPPPPRYYDHRVLPTVPPAEIGVTLRLLSPCWRTIACLDHRE